MKKIKEMDSLLNVYGKLLSEKKLIYLQASYFEDLSLQEIADKYQVSRAAVHEAITVGTHELENFEMQLNFLKLQNQRIRFYQQHITDPTLLDALMVLEQGGLKC